MPDPLTENPLISSFFFADPTGQGMTYEQLKARRAMAAALASKGRDYPNTVGKGIFSLGESIGGAISDYKLDAEEKRIRAGDSEAAKELRKLHPSYTPPDAPPVAPPGPAAAPAPTTGPRAELDPAVDAARAELAASLTPGGPGPAQTAGPAPIRMAALPSAGTMSDAGRPGATYGGPSPAGPGASMAERPDQAPPAPSAPPPGMAGPGPGGTPAPQPVAGGGVPAGPVPGGGGAMPPAVDAARAGLAQQIAGENQAFNPDAAGPGDPGGGIPPQMLAQVGGFGGGTGAGPAPAPTPPGVPGTGAPGLPALPSTAPGVAPPPGGVRPGATPSFMPMTEGEAVRRYGAADPPPAKWTPGEYAKYRQATDMSLDANRSAEFRKRAADTADAIEKANDARYKQAEERWKARDLHRQGRIDEGNKLLWGEQEKQRDPIEIQKRNTAAREARLEAKSGLPTERLFKTMDTELDAARVATSRQEDNKIVLDALKSGLPITGAWAEPRLDAARFGAWALNNPALAARAGSTEMLRAKLLNGVSSAIKDLKPISNVEVQLGQKMVGNIEQQPEVLKALVEQSIGRNNRDLAKYDTRAHRFFDGEGAIAETYKSPNATWFNPKHLQILFNEAGRDPGVIAEFNSRYGPHSAEFALNRKKLNPKAGTPEDTP